MRSRALQAALVRSFLAGVAYFAIVFAAGFILGTVRVLGGEPFVEALAAVALETPFILGVSWVASGFLTRRLSVAPMLFGRVLMGACAFVFLMAAELSLSTAAFGRSAGEFAAGLLEPTGLLGVSAQVVFAALPALRLIGMQRR
jgi:hypothetical protein